MAGLAYTVCVDVSGLAFLEFKVHTYGVVGPFGQVRWRFADQQEQLANSARHFPSGPDAAEFTFIVLAIHIADISPRALYSSVQA
ncbi:hypothetical protein HCB17_02480 [Salinispora arenicola]|uniref:Uncharacterized protein n=1 Tax=Salinispora arenicola TaxID=168697 RepID=A0A542XTE4_SALAC|nr:hypothetical protein [Salinispora arenicola]NIL40162.1 hypothetical protein [Salinispora arenicola]TQL39102.1 hypothetical protein FB564_4325 [Salinispora arenicola]GIM88001.1 hypothetical protein Sar04_47370 [Salinispora arenicola]